MVFTLIFSIKNLSIPFRKRYKPNILPGAVIFFLLNQSTRKRIVHAIISYKVVGKTGGFNWFSSYSGLESCEKSCTDKCEPQCKSTCTDASFLAHDNKEVVSLQNEIKLLELSIDRIESKLNL